ncbi:MAG: TIGR02611 family protein [Janthinobacterium lividum]
MIRTDARRNRVYRSVVGVVGVVVVVLGLVLVPLPGPGWLVVFLGLAVLGSEFSSARRLNAFARTHVQRWSQWVARRSLGARIGLGSLTVVVVAGIAWGYLVWQGLPSWSPEVVTAQLARVPGL